MASVLFLIVAQLVIGYEWINYKASAYFGKAFEFDRVFFFKWSVNWQFLGEEMATGKPLAKILLVAQLSLLLIFLLFKWTSITRGLGSWLREIRLTEIGRTIPRKLDPRFVALSMFTCNLIGILCARSLHYQFYSWYYQTLPLILLFIKKVPLIFK
jgi:alpha-1,3-mannosyltransferase